jgi:hypothetical protein
MSESSVFDASPYLRSPRVDVRQGVALAIALINAAPKSATAGVKRAAQQVRERSVTLQAVWRGRQRAAGVEKRDPTRALADNRVDVAFGALRTRLDGYAALPADTHPRAARAAELIRVLFPDGMEFLKLPWDAQWAACDEVVKRIDEDALAADIDELAGEAFLAEVRSAQAHYGDALGITKPEAPAEAADPLLDPLRELLRAIGDYTLQVVASVDRDRPETIAAARVALHPMDRYRERAAKRKAGKGQPALEPEPDTTPDTPVPDLPQ